MINCGARWAKKYNMARSLSSGYTILSSGYKFRVLPFEISGYTRTVGGWRGLSIMYIDPSGHFVFNEMFCGSTF